MLLFLALSVAVAVYLAVAAIILHLVFA